jgi:hypothetical protein
MSTGNPAGQAGQAGQSGQVIYDVRNCTNWDSERNRCNVKTCKQDEKSDCKDFAAACLDTGHHYSGTAEGGT